MKRCLSSFALAGFSVVTAAALLYARPQTETGAEQGRDGKHADGTHVHARLFSARTARELIGRRVEARTGDVIGRVNDVVINPRTGETLFVVVISGGFAGVGAKWKPVPPQALSPSWTQRGVLAMDISPKHWKTAPRMNKERLATLQQPGIAEDIYAFYHQPWGGDPGVAPPARSSDPAQPPLKLASDLMGQSVLNIQHGEIGRVSDLTVDLKNPRMTRAIVTPTNSQHPRFMIPLHDFGYDPAGNALFLNTELGVFESFPRSERAVLKQPGHGA